MRCRLVLLLLLPACGLLGSRPATVTTVAIPPAVRDAVDAADRPVADRTLDPGRKPAETLAFFGVGPGMRVAELGAGGVSGIVDHSARPGSGTADVQSLHRIEERVVRDEVTAAGFRLAAAASFLRNPADPRDWNDAPRVAGERRGTSDRFVLKFVKP
jgi:predicted methyltransferase